MSGWAAFRRIRRFLIRPWWRTALAWLCAALDGVTLVGLVIMLGLLAEMVYHCHMLIAEQRAPASSGLFAFMCTWCCSCFPSWHQQVQGLLYLLLIAFVVAALRLVCQRIHAGLIAYEVAEAVARLRRAIYRQALRIGSTEFSGVGAVPAVQLFREQTERVRQGLLVWLFSSVREPVRIVLLLGLALAVHTALTLLLLLLAALGAFALRRVMARSRARADEAVRGAEQRLALLEESLRIIRLTRGYLMEPYSQERFERHLADQMAAEQRRLRSLSAVGPAAEFVTLTVVGLIVGLASLNLLAGVLSPGSTVAFYASIAGMYWPIAAIWRGCLKLRAAMSASITLCDFLDQHAQLVQVAGASFLPPVRDSIEFDRVRVVEPSGTVLLDDINLEIPAGTRTAVMGLDEREKRALVFLIPRFLDPTEGQVRIDGQDIRLVTLESLRAQVSLVLQDALVFTDTVAGNIGCGEPGYGLPQIIEAAKMAHAHQFIRRLPKGYDTVIGDHGLKLSTSEQFRIALARAILHDPAVVVIEEPHQPLDRNTKKLLDDTIMRFTRGRTVIFLPHRLSTIRSCDFIVLLHNGRIESLGTHRRLTRESELYRHIQYTEFNVFVR